MQHRITSLAVLLGAASLAACAEGTGPNGANRPVSLSFSTSATATASASPSLTPSRSVSFTSGANSLVITKAQLVLARVELQRVGATCASTASAGDDQDDEHSCAELELAPSLIDLPVDSSVATALGVSIPTGTYSSLEAKVRPVRTEERGGTGSSAFLTAHPDFANASVRVEGTWNGTPFTYIGTPRAEIETEFNPPVTVDTAKVNLTIHVNLASWFRDASGALVNPATANAGGANATLVSSNISRSFRAYRDDDRDGRDDQEEGGEHR